MPARKTKTEKAAPEPISAEMLSQLMGQLQALASEVSELKQQVTSSPQNAFPGEQYDPDDSEDRVTDEEAAALLEAFEAAMETPVDPEPEVQEALPGGGVVMEVEETETSMSETIEVEGSEQTEEVAEVELSDEEIAAAMEEQEPVASSIDSTGIASETDSAEPDDEFYGELIDLSEDALAQLVRQNIERQAEALDIPAQDDESILSADTLVELIQEPDPSDGVPKQSVAMSEDELAILLSQASQLVQDQGEPAVAAGSSKNSEPGRPVHPAAAVQRIPSGEFDLGAVRTVPAHLAVRALALPICFEEGKIVCKVAEPIDRAALDRLSKEIGLGVIPRTAPMGEIVSGLRQAYSETSDLQARLAMTQNPKKSGRGLSKLARIWKKGA